MKCYRITLKLFYQVTIFRARKEDRCQIRKKSTCKCVLSCFNCVRLFETLWTVACQAPLSIGFSRQGYWSEVPFSLPGDFINARIKPQSSETPVLQVDSLSLSHWGKSFPFNKGHQLVTKLIQFCHLTALVTTWGNIQKSYSLKIYIKAVDLRLALSLTVFSLLLSCLLKIDPEEMC